VKRKNIKFDYNRVKINKAFYNNKYITSNANPRYKVVQATEIVQNKVVKGRRVSQESLSTI
jgi:hypothetical protein